MITETIGMLKQHTTESLEKMTSSLQAIRRIALNLLVLLNCLLFWESGLQAKVQRNIAEVNKRKVTDITKPASGGNLNHLAYIISVQNFTMDVIVKFISLSHSLITVVSNMQGVLSSDCLLVVNHEKQVRYLNSIDCLMEIKNHDTDLLIQCRSWLDTTYIIRIVPLWVFSLTSITED